MKFKQNLLILSAILVAVLILAAGCLPAVDTDAPKLSTAVYTDVDSSETVNLNDRVVFTFNEEMEKSTITSSNVASRLPLSASGYGTGPTVSWNTAGTVCTVTLGTSPTIVSGTTVNPSSLVTDVAGNADNSSAVTISGFPTTGVLASVSITPSTASTTPGGATVTLTAKALDTTAGGDITSLCTLTWTISGTANGTISPTTGSSTVYTPPSSGTGTDTITVTAVYAGVTKTATATITVVVVVPPTPLVDPDKLFVSAQNQNAKYTLLPAGATVKVYSDPANDAALAFLGGVKVTIISSDTWTGASFVIGATDYIFFTLTDSGGWTSPITADGQIPALPNGTALGNIQATSKNTVTSSAAGNVAGNDKITLYVGGIAYSAATPVGSTMTVAPDLVAGDAPRYTRTNPDGHESILSAADGVILILTTAVDANGGGVGSTLDSGDTLTLNFGGNVDVNVPITISNISWVATGTATLGTGTLAPTGTGLGIVVLIATVTCTDFAGGETANFNILPNTPIVDTTGGNQVLPAATAFPFDETDF